MRVDNVTNLTRKLMNPIRAEVRQVNEKEIGPGDPLFNVFSAMGCYRAEMDDYGNGVRVFFETYQERDAETCLNFFRSRPDTFFNARKIPSPEHGFIVQAAVHLGESKKRINESFTSTDLTNIAVRLGVKVFKVTGSLYDFELVTDYEGCQALTPTIQANGLMVIEDDLYKGRWIIKASKDGYKENHSRRIKMMEVATEGEHQHFCPKCNQIKTCDVKGRCCSKPYPERNSEMTCNACAISWQ